MKELILERQLPNVLENVSTSDEWKKRRAEIADLLQKEEYGYLPPKPDSVEFYEEKNCGLKNFAAGKA